MPDLDANVLPLVSAVVTTYKSERLLSKALESILNQQVNFPIEIVIADDCSPDETLVVARGYRDRYPHLIHLLEREVNVGTQRNYYDAFEKCRGKYIAWLDADDYWTEPQKLNLQVEMLEKDPTVMICGHFVRWVQSNGQITRERYPNRPAGRYEMKDIISKNFLPSPSVVFRNGLQRKLPDWYFDVSPLTDWPLYIVAARSGSIVLLDQIMADYTLNPTSAFWGQGDTLWYKTDADFYERIESIIPAEFHRLARAEKSRRYEGLSNTLRQRGEYAAARKAAIKAIRAPSLLDISPSTVRALLSAVVYELIPRWGKRISG